MLFPLPLSLILLVSSTIAQPSSGSAVVPSASLPGTPLSSASFASASRSGASSVVNGSSSVVPSSTNSAEFPSLSGYSSCVDQCLDMAIADTGCASVVDVECFCTNTTIFTNGLVQCLAAQCPSSISAAEGLSQQFCNLASPSVSLTFPSASLTSSKPPSTPLSSSSSRPASSTSTPPTMSHTASSTLASTPSASSTTSGALAVYRTPGLDIAVATALALAIFGMALGC
ncbi:hypothetical protein BKA93DRAFT_240759 [Sparassis latifolia]